MKLRDRSFPYPVVGNKDDVPNADFQVTIEVLTDAQSVIIDFTILNNSETLNGLLESGAAKYAAHVECSATSFRQLFQFDSSSHRLTIPVDELRGNVELNCFVMATKPISRYTVVGQHEDYARFTFNVKAGDILARSSGFQFPIDHDYTGFEQIGSILEVICAPSPGDRPMLCDLSGDKIQVILSQKDFEAYQQLRYSQIARVLEASVVLPALMAAVESLRNDVDDDLRWQRVVRARIEKLTTLKDDESLGIAQQLLELPIRRALSAATSIEEAV